MTDSDDLISMDEAPELEVKNDAETIERVLLSRTGLKGATGHKTTWYNVLDNGDPNASYECGVSESETHYLIKWKNWSHIHNTWESEGLLKEQKANGIKKLENYIRKEEEINEW